MGSKTGLRASKRGTNPHQQRRGRCEDKLGPKQGWVTPGRLPTEDPTGLR